MTIERAFLVRLPGDNPSVAALVADIRGARSRATKALPGDRIDIARYELVSAQLESLAHAAHLRGAVTQSIPIVDADVTAMVDDANEPRLTPDAAAAVTAWRESGDVAVELRLPFGPGETASAHAAEPVRPPADRWVAPPGVEGTRAVAIRFRHQLEGVLGGRPGVAVTPSGVSNGVITQVLREFAAGSGPAVEAPIIYRDGSSGRPFPLRAVQLLDEIPERGWNVLRFALLSIRHMEMDVEVDGAWLRNTDISRPRPAGETDELAFEISRRQLSQICDQGPCLVYMYQTGLQPAVIGLYRAITLHLIQRPGSLAIVPMFFRESGTDRPDAEWGTNFSEGKPWTA